MMIKNVESVTYRYCQVFLIQLEGESLNFSHETPTAHSGEAFFSSFTFSLVAFEVEGHN